MQQWNYTKRFRCCDRAYDRGMYEAALEHARVCLGFGSQAISPDEAEALWRASLPPSIHSSVFVSAFPAGWGTSDM